MEHTLCRSDFKSTVDADFFNDLLYNIGISEEDFDNYDTVEIEFRHIKKDEETIFLS